ncbi:hypothetical protein V12G01_19332 [Vibrio alginolyticus 12G01]|uniref:hypothetical protein n=1 Tax=Vibrio alginolyticus TaxID=663 RepID=UPI0000D52EA8|nr:hypothetical protein [Vibrio alginolyticus]EAS77686.1 hypothetical protein V12G01_19332 [Vibrio alginolyticus 12G01]MCS0112102.1 hypothetical protein [Vibrio alginolyticus]
MLRSTNFLRMLIRVALFLGTSISLIGCQATSQEPVEALSKKNSPETVIEIQNAIAEIQGTPAPRIANNVFESSPHLLIEKGRVKGNNNQLLDGSYTDLPDQYTLQIRGETCGLYYAKTDTFVSLSSLDCEPIIKF